MDDKKSTTNRASVRSPNTENNVSCGPDSQARFETSRVSDKDENLSKQRLLANGGQTFRIRGVPLDWDANLLQSFLSDRDDLIVPSVRSLAQEIHGRSQTATVSSQHDRRPPAKATTSWQIPLPPDVTSSARLRSLTLDDGFVGVTTLYAPQPEHHKIDIVAISGLGGHAFGSFKERAGEHMWLRDALPYDITEAGDINPVARVMVYGYRSTLPESESTQNLEDLATSLHSSLVELASAATIKPIIFIAHSLGGLIVKEMLVLLSRSSNKDDQKLFQATCGIVFFGVPHDGMDISSLIPMVNDGPNRFLLESLTAMNSQVLSVQQREFNRALGPKAELEIIHFYETRKSPTAIKDAQGKWHMRGPLALLVTKPSATHGRPREDGPEHICAVDRTHSEMVKFGPEDDEYEKARLRIQRLTQRTLKKWGSMSKNSVMDDVLDKCPGSLAGEVLNGCLRSLAFRQMHDRSQDIEIASKKTCEWLFRHEKYTKWATCGRDILWIKGKPGSGKSTMLKYILDNHRARHGDIVLSFFFHGRGEELQRTPFGLFRCLLHQILKLAPGSLRDLLNTYAQKNEEYGETDDEWQWHPEELWRFFESSVKRILETRRIWLFVDALDECGKDHAVSLVGRFLALYQNCASTRSQLLICFTCRHYPILDAHCKFEICTEDENSDDISTFVNSRLSGFYTHVSTTIPGLIATRANGIFMWARLVVQQVLNLDREGESLDVIEVKINSIPQDLNELYQGLLHTMELSSLKLIQWLCFATRPLSLNELRWAIALDTDLPHRSLQEFQIGVDDPDNHRLKRRIQTLSCGLAEIMPYSDPKIVQFIHQSVKEFFVEKGLSILGQTTSSHDAVASAHHRLFRSCTYYLAMNEFGDSANLELDYLEFRFPFLRYATTSWVTHARESDKGYGSQEYLLEHLAGRSNGIMERWVRWYGVFERKLIMERMSNECPPPGTLLEHVMSRYEMKQAWSAALERRHQIDININAKDSHGRTPLSWAAAAGHGSIVRLLLEEGARMEVTDRHFGRTPLLWATVAGHEAIVRMLLGGGANIEAMDNEGLTALLTAVTAGKEAAVRVLLNWGARIEAVDKSEGETPLWRAAAGGHEAIVKMLLDRGARIEAADKRYGQTPLWRAATAGHEAIVKMLLDRGARIEAADKCYGHTPLWRAATSGHRAVLRLLLERGAKTHVAGNTGQMLLCRAVEAGHEVMVQLLLERGVNIEAAEGNSQAALPWFKRLLGQRAEAQMHTHYSLTPLLCRAAKAGHVPVARLLLDRGADIEIADMVDRTPLLWAVMKERMAMVELLLERGARIESRDKNDRSPLSLATTCEDISVLELLLTRGADIESRDKNGQTPLSWAASSGDVYNTRLLLDKGANIESKDIYGSTPLLRAIGGKHEVVVQLLLHAGADVKVAGKNGLTPLSMARMAGHQGIVSLLQSYLEPPP